MADPFKHPATGIYYLRRKVPLELRSALGREFKRSLKTRELSSAKVLFAQAWLESEQAFALARTQLGGVDVISMADAQQLAARWFRNEQERIERDGSFSEKLVEGPGWAQECAGERVEWVTRITLRQAAEQGEEFDWDGLVGPHIRRSLSQHSLPMPPADSGAYVRLQTAFLEHLHKLSDWAEKRNDGAFVLPGQDVAPIVPLATERPQEKPVRQIKLKELFKSYSSDKVLNDGDTRSTRKTISDYEAIADRFIELQGDLDIREISREVIGSYRAALAQLPAKGAGIRGLTARQLIAKAEAERLPRLSEPTIRNQLRAVSA